MVGTQSCVASPGLRLFVVVFGGDRLEIFGFEYLTAVETLDVIDTVTTGQYLSAVVFASGLHSTKQGFVYEL